MRASDGASRAWRTASIFGAMSASHDLQRQLTRLELCLPRTLG